MVILAGHTACEAVVRDLLDFPESQIAVFAQLDPVWKNSELNLVPAGVCKLVERFSILPGVYDWLVGVAGRIL